MKMVRDTTGRFRLRPHYEPEELDRECESIVSGFLRKKYGEVRYPLKTEDLQSLIESEARDLDSYADLGKFGSGVEGVTIFNPGGKPDVKISDELASSPSRENRLRTTLAHEYGHVHFHTYLFDAQFADMDLFAEKSSRKPDQTQVCKRDTIVNASATDWMEWQAGHVCGAVLMPGAAVRAFLRANFADVIDAEQLSVGTADSSKVIGAVQEEFQASNDAARVRLLRLRILMPSEATARLV